MKTFFEITSNTNNEIRFAGLEVKATSQEGHVVIAYQMTYHDQDKNKMSHLHTKSGDAVPPAIMRSFSLLPNEDFVEAGMQSIKKGLKAFVSRLSLDTSISEIGAIEHFLKSELTDIKASIRISSPKASQHVGDNYVRSTRREEKPTLHVVG